jgi:hypothetical protein
MVVSRLENDELMDNYDGFHGCSFKSIYIYIIYLNLLEVLLYRDTRKNGTSSIYHSFSVGFSCSIF